MNGYSNSYYDNNNNNNLLGIILGKQVASLLAVLRWCQVIWGQWVPSGGLLQAWACVSQCRGVGEGG
jgi:hypothetical protein